MEEGILFSRKMWSDHFPWYVLAVLQANTKARAANKTAADVGSVSLHKSPSAVR